MRRADSRVGDAESLLKGSVLIMMRTFEASALVLPWHVSGKFAPGPNTSKKPALRTSVPANDKALEWQPLPIQQAAGFCEQQHLANPSTKEVSSTTSSVISAKYLQGATSRSKTLALWHRLTWQKVHLRPVTEWPSDQHHGHDRLCFRATVMWQSSTSQHCESPARPFRP